MSGTKPVPHKSRSIHKGRVSTRGSYASRCYGVVCSDVAKPRRRELRTQMVFFKVGKEGAHEPHSLAAFVIHVKGFHRSTTACRPSRSRLKKPHVTKSYRRNLHREIFPLKTHVFIDLPSLRESKGQLLPFLVLRRNALYTRHRLMMVVQ